MNAQVTDVAYEKTRALLRALAKPTQDSTVSLRLSIKTRIMLEKIAARSFDCSPETRSDSDFGLGHKVIFPMSLKDKPIELSDCIYLYADSHLPNVPKDTQIGFTEEEVIDLTSVYMFRKVRGRFYGETFPLDALLHELADLSLRDRITSRVYKMTEAIRLDEDFIELANMERAQNRNRAEYGLN